MTNFLCTSRQDIWTFFTSQLYLFVRRIITMVPPICRCFLRSVTASEAAHFISHPLSIILPTPSITNYSQINNVPRLFGLISGSFCLHLCSDRRGKAVSTPASPSN